MASGSAHDNERDFMSDGNASEVISPAPDAELIDWMQSTTWIIEINDSSLGGHVVKMRHRKYHAPTLREAITKAMRDKP